MSITRISVGGYNLPLTGEAAGQPPRSTTIPDPGTVPANPSPARPDQPGREALWMLTRGEYDDTRTLGIVEGPEQEIRAAIEQLNAARLELKPNDYDPFDYEEVHYLGSVNTLTNLPLTGQGAIGAGEGNER